MGIEEIVSRIKQEAHDQANSGIAEARKKADALRKEFEADLEKRKQTMEHDMEREIQFKAGIILSRAKREVRDSTLQIKESLIQECIDTALSTLHDLQEEESQKLLVNLVNRAREQVGDQCVVSLTNEGHRELLSGLQGVELTDELAPGSGGVVVFSPDRSLRVNNTFEGILLRKSGEIRSMAARILFS